jgi:hypothetical protein
LKCDHRFGIAEAQAIAAPLWRALGQQRELTGADAAAPGEFRERRPRNCRSPGSAYSSWLPTSATSNRSESIFSKGFSAPMRLNRSMDCVQTKSGRRSSLLPVGSSVSHLQQKIERHLVPRNATAADVARVVLDPRKLGRAVFDHARILALARGVAELGIEMDGLDQT